MSVAVASAIVERLNGIDFLRRNLAVYQGSPAIFTATSIPEGTDYPYVWAPDFHATADDDAKNATLFNGWRDVGVYALDKGSDSLIEDLAWSIRRALHKRPLALDVDENIVLNAAPPIVAPTGDGVLGRIVQLRLLISEG